MTQAALQQALCNSMSTLVYSDTKNLQRRIACSPALMTQCSDEPVVVFVEYHEEVRGKFLHRELRLFVTGVSAPQDILPIGEGAKKLALGYKMLGKFLAQMDIL